MNKLYCFDGHDTSHLLYKYLVYILNAKNLAPPFLSIFFWIKIDDIKNQCSFVFMPVQKTIVVEKSKVCMKSCLHFYEKNVKS